MQIRRAFITSTAITALACSGDPSADGEWRGTVRDSAGVTIIENPGVGTWTPETAWTVEPTVTIGTAEGDPFLQFGQIAGMALSDNGDVYVLDFQAGEIRSFSANGDYLRTIGRKGNGPGEIAAPVGFLEGAGDTLIVPDLGARRVSRFLPDGTDAGSTPIDMTKGIPAKFETMANGRLVAQLRPFTGGGGTPVSVGTTDVIAAFGAEPGTLDTLVAIPAGETFRLASDVPQIRIFAPEPMWTLGDEDAVFVARNNETRIDRYVSGQLTTIITRASAAQPVTDADKRLIEGALQTSLRDQAGLPPAAIERVMDNMSIADQFPTLLQLQGGPDGSLWVQRFTQFSELSDDERKNFNPLQIGSRHWEVFDAGGRFLGEVQMPERFQPLRFRDDRVFGIWRDELDVQYAMVAVIHQP